MEGKVLTEKGQQELDYIPTRKKQAEYEVSQGNYMINKALKDWNK